MAIIDMDILLSDLEIPYSVEEIGEIEENPYTVFGILRYDNIMHENDNISKYGLLVLGYEELLFYIENYSMVIKPRLLVIIGGILSEEHLSKIAMSFSGIIITVSELPGDITKTYLRIMQAVEKQNILQQELIENNYLDLVSMLACGATIGDFEKFGSKLLNNPIIITNESFVVLAYSHDYDVNDPVWDEIITNQYSSSELVSKTDINQFWDRLENSSTPLFVDEKAFKDCAKRAVAKMKSGSKSKGYIALIEINRRITSLDLHILKVFAEILSVKINEKDVISKAIGQEKNDFADDLLNGNMSSLSMIKSRAKNLQFKFSQWNAVLCVYSDKRDRYIGRELSDISAKLKEIFDLTIYTFDGTYAFFILSFNKKNVWKKTLNKDLEMFAKRNHLTLTLSLPTDELMMIKDCYTQVRAMNHVLELDLRQENSIYSYNYLVPYHMIAKLYESEDRQIYENRTLQTLLDIDSKTGSEYVETLRSYFLNNQNVTQTAKDLFVHRNTVNYRLNKIRELIEDDFDDSLIRLHLQIAIMAKDMYE